MLVQLPPKDVAAAFDAMHGSHRTTLLAVRKLILAVAEEVEAGSLTETLKWGEPAYLTEASKSGTTIRLGISKKSPDHAAMFVHCQTTLVSEFRETLVDPAITFEDNRAVLFAVEAPLPKAALQHCIAQALTYKRR